jgi:glycosyltransferase involved in cell wall biosynthesis
VYELPASGVSRRLLILSPSGDRGGAESYMVTVARAAYEAGWEVTVGFESNARTRGIVAELERSRGISYVNGRLGDEGRRGTILRQIQATLRLISRVRPDAMMVTPNWPTRGLGCMLGAAVAHVPTAVVFQLAAWPLAPRPSRAAYRWAQNRRQVWVAVSNHNRDVLAQTFEVSADSIRTIYTGVPQLPEPTAAEVEAARRDVRSELGVPDDATVVLTVGRLHPQKGYLELLPVLPAVVKQWSNTFFAWAGDGQLRPELEARIRGANLERRVHILGRREDVPTLLRGSDLFLLPSRYEGLSFALLEAMAHGLPTLSSDAGGAPEALRDGIDGLIHRREDPDDLAEKLSWALDHPQEMLQMAASARIRVAGFSETQMLERTLSLMDELLLMTSSRSAHRAGSGGGQLPAGGGT